MSPGEKVLDRRFGNVDLKESSRNAQPTFPVPVAMYAVGHVTVL